jgi:hypothetical protein
MRYTLEAGPADLTHVDRVLAALDPAALCDFDMAACTIRIQTAATHAELLAGLSGAGVQATTATLFQLPSECCGGCGG